MAQLCPTLCNPMNHSMPGLPVHHQLLESTQTHVHRVGDAIQPSHPLSSPSPPALNRPSIIRVFSSESAFRIRWPKDWNFSFRIKESWMLKNQCFLTVVLEKTFESPLDYKEIKPVNPKGTQSWIFIGRTDAEAETPILQPPDAKNWLTGKDADAGKDWRQEEKGMTGWDGWMASPMLWTWVLASSGSWWWTGKPGMLQSMGLQRVRHG